MLLLEKVASVSMAISYCLGDRGPGRVLLNHRDLWTSEHSEEFPPSLSNDCFFCFFFFPLLSSALSKSCPRWLC